jgi:V/A-type H+/Na+-transporting ATPase subunit A
LPKQGDSVAAGDWLGEVDENGQPHKIMVPFKFAGRYKVKSVVSEGNIPLMNTIAVLLDGRKRSACYHGTEMAR